MNSLLARSLTCLLILLSLSGCTGDSRELRFHMLNHWDLDSAGLEEIFQQQAGIKMDMVHSSPGQGALDALLAGETDLALVNNSHPFTPGVRAIMPVYKSVLHLLVRKDLAANADVRSLKGKTVFIANNSQAGHRLLELLAERQNLQDTDYQLVELPDPKTTDLIIFFGPINPDSTIWKNTEFRLVELASSSDAEAQLSRTGLSYLLPRMEVTEIPARTYPIDGNENTIKTIGVDTLLVTRKDLSINMAYLLAKTLFENKPRFIAVAPSIFSGIRFSFDPMELNFPLHPGARRYLERDEPGFLERYAETINMLVYLVFLLISSFLAFARWRAHRKKDRIDTFYTRALGIRERADGVNNMALKQELLALEQEAFHSLIGEKLAANESFRIFTDLLGRIHQELESTHTTGSDVPAVFAEAMGAKQKS
jgi:TRAP-type uncharacterized transport system substrate-binding protein